MISLYIFRSIEKYNQLSGIDFSRDFNPYSGAFGTSILVFICVPKA